MSNGLIHPDGSPCDCGVPPVKFQWPDLLVLATTFALGIAKVVEHVVNQADDLARQHANYHRDQVELQQDAADFAAAVKAGIDQLS